MRIKNIFSPRQIPVAAMADIAFLLLIFLLVTSSLDQSRELDIDLPQVVKVESIPQDQVFIIFIDKNETIYYKGNEVTIDSLIFEFDNHQSLFNDPILQVVGDSEIPYQIVDNLIQTLRKDQPLKIAFISRGMEDN